MPARCFTPRPVTAYAAVNALGHFRPEGQAALERAETGLRSASSLGSVVGEPFTTLPFTTHLGAVTGLPPLPPDLAAWDTRQSRLGFAAFRQIAPQVTHAVERWGKDRVALVLGSSTGGMAEAEAAYAAWTDTGAVPPHFDLWRHHSFDGLNRALVQHTGISGPSYAVSTACSSSGKAFGSALRLLESGAVDAVVVGGVDSLCQLTVFGFHSLAILASDACRPFAADRSGISIGEGAAFVLVERELSTGAVAAGYVLGVGESSDGYHMTAPHPEGLGAERAMREALSQAGLHADQVNYVNAHGTGTALNDAAEAQAIARVFSHGVAVSSTKGYFGHLLGGAGAAEAVVCLAALEQQRLPVHLPLNAMEPGLAINVVERSTALAAPLSYALSNSLAFGGSNVSVLFGRGIEHRDGASGVQASAHAAFEVDVLDVALWTTGFADAHAWSCGVPDPLMKEPACAFLAPRVRGRASLDTRVLLEVLSGLLPKDTEHADPRTVPTLFASSCGEMQTTLALLRSLCDAAGEFSPARFRASVHNTASGIFSIEQRNLAFSTALAAGYATVPMALVEGMAWVQVHGGALAVTIGDGESPYPLVPAHSYGPFGVGLLLQGRPHGQERSRAALGTLRAVVPTRAACEIPAGPWRDNPCAVGTALCSHLLERRVGELSLKHPSAPLSDGQVGWALQID